jgi:hypothetical protein
MSPERLVHTLYAASRILLGSAVLVNLLAFIGKIAETGNIGSGLLAVLSWFNPGNTEAFVGEVVLFSPAVFAYLLAEYLERRGAG